MKKRTLFLYFALCFVYTHAENTNGPSPAEELYIKLFKRRRVEHLEAVKSLQRITCYEKKYQMVILMAEKVFTVIQNSRARIEASGFVPGITEFPQDEQTKETLSSILENTALFAEVVIRLPDISASVLKINNNWDILLQWSIAFTNQVRYLLDKGTIRLLSLVSQELNHIERDPNYVNPYRKAKEEKQLQQEERHKEEKKKKKTLKKGPRIHQDL